jgi:hypothetical protein
MASIRVRIGLPPLSIEVVIAGEGANSMSQVTARVGVDASAMADPAHAAKKSRVILPMWAMNLDSM